MRRSLPFLAAAALAAAALPAQAQRSLHPAAEATNLFCRGTGGSGEDSRRVRAILDGDASAGVVGPFRFDAFALNVANRVRTADAELDVSIIRVPGQPAAGCLVAMVEQPGYAMDDPTVTRAFDRWAGAQSPRFQRRARSIAQDGGGYMSSWVREVGGQEEFVMVVTYPARVGEPPQLVVLFGLPN